MTSSNQSGPGFDWSAHCATHGISRPAERRVLDPRQVIAPDPAPPDPALIDISLSAPEDTTRNLRWPWLAAAAIALIVATWVGTQAVIAALRGDAVARTATPNLAPAALPPAALPTEPALLNASATAADPDPQPPLTLLAEPIVVRKGAVADTAEIVSRPQAEIPAVALAPDRRAPQPVESPKAESPRAESLVASSDVAPAAVIRPPQPHRIVIKRAPSVATASIAPSNDPRLTPPVHSAVPPPRPAAEDAPASQVTPHPQAKAQAKAPKQAVVATPRTKSARPKSIAPASPTVTHELTVLPKPPSTSHRAPAKTIAQVPGKTRRSVPTRSAPVDPQPEYATFLGMRVRVGNPQWAKDLQLSSR